MKKFKNQNGITLIALVVTIVVLLILAGVSINMVLGNNGLITKAKDAKEQTEQDQVNTEKAINSLVDEMDAILGNGGSGDTGNGDGDGAGNDGDGDGSGDTIDLTGLKIGDYVNYTYDTVANYTNLTGTGSTSNPADGIAQSSATLQWRVLNIDEENGTIDLVSSEPTDNTVYFSGALGYNNGVYLLNDMCAHLYSNSSLGVTARSIDLVDMEKHLTTTGIAARNAYVNTSSNTQYGSTKTYTGSYSYYPNLYATQKGAGINLAEGATVTQPDLSGVDPYNESAKVYSTPTTETYSQATDTGLTVTQTYYYIPIDSTNYGEAAAVLSNSNYFWVASRYARCYSTYAYFGLRCANTYLNGNYMFDSSNNTNNYYIRLRPVVSLSSSLLDGTKDASGAWNLVSAE